MKDIKDASDRARFWAEDTIGTPRMLTVVDLNEQQINRITQLIPGGAANIQDVYALSPAQRSVLFRVLLDGNAQAYSLSTLFELHSSSQVPDFIDAVQRVVDRHDILRSAVLWEDLPEPLQVVCRRASVPVEVVELEARDTRDQLRELLSTERQLFDLTRAPLMRLQIVVPEGGEAWAALHLHHVACDDQSWRAAIREVLALLGRQSQKLPTAQPYRDYVVQALHQSEAPAAREFFRSKLADIDEPTAPFGFIDALPQDGRTSQAQRGLEESVASRLREAARRAGVSAARIFHAAWGLVVAHLSAKDDVVYGTVLLNYKQSAQQDARMLGTAINTLPLRLRLAGETAESLLRQTHEELRALIEHRHASLQTAQQCSGLSAGVPLFTSLLNFRHREGGAPDDASDAALPRILLQRGARTSYPITVSVDDLGFGFDLIAQTDARLNPRALIDYLHVATCSLVGALEHAPRTPALSLAIMPEEERHRLTQVFNATDLPYPRNRAIHELFELRAEREPSAVAIVYEGEVCTYAELNARSNQLARLLRRHSVQSGDYVPVHMVRSLEMVIAQLALLKLGAVYVPIDPGMPVERRSFMVRDCGARLVLADDCVPFELQDERLTWLKLADAVESRTPEEAADLRLPVSPLAAAYVMYTSGSTGTPKGVVVPHHAVNRLAINNGYAHFEPHDCFVHYSNPTFDASTFELWCALLNGASVVVVPQETVLDTARFSRLLQRCGATVLYMSAGLFNEYVDAGVSVFAQLRYLFVGGDSLKPDAIRRALRNPPGALLNAYGPTECTTFATTHLIDAVEAGAPAIPIGRPIANAQIHILSPWLELSPLGAIGEIYIGGAGVACGYLNRPELTLERFIPDPFSADAQARLYRTGDLGRWRADGVVEFLGRNDHQVKIRGFRVELGEIEAQLHRLGEVKDAVVVACDEGAGEKRLVGYVVLHETARVDRASAAEQLRGAVRDALPEYMVPSAIVVIDRLPLTQNGKVDRRALPAPDIAAFGLRQYVAPKGETEEIVAAIWQELLGVEQIGRYDDFFELGGHSLLATQTITRLRRALSIELPIKLLFDFPTVEGLASRVEDARRMQAFRPPSDLEGGIAELLEHVASMPDSQVRALLGELTRENRS